MKKILVPTLIALALGSVTGLAQAQAAAPASSLSFNVGAVSDYRYRGISQSRLQPALQGGLDYADKSGFYVGAWGSSIKWIKDTPGVTKGATELDLYGGYKGEFSGVSYDIGLLSYVYSGNNYGNATAGGTKSANTNEAYAAVTLGPVTAKYSHAYSDLFGNAGTKNSYYLDLSAAFDLGSGFSLTPHVGYQKFKNLAVATYTDYSLTLAKDLGNGLSASAAVVGTDADKVFYNLKDKFNGKSGLVVGLKYAF
ncbi:hypothetical protein B9Z45_03875 [Limnohabitans sp. 2KL-17]|uniref:TorF family putative porin n=1 Tax=Limnohabitans sp. 2KL-17 TaxID=1100704 RepID=UPI000D37FAA4|nr:TorF family putative porin [Limnohabitans sp. 2KL-17]PUE62474.1 hypothetical protein B9Z45_03875 [Limnohabitans sp. 2KL-17]